MRLPPLGIAARLTLLTVALVVIGQLIGAALLFSLEVRLEAQRTEAVLIERTVQATRLLEFTGGSGRRLSRRPGFSVGSSPADGDAMPRGTSALVAALQAEGLGDRQARLVRSDGRRGPMLEASVELEPGRWLNVRLPLRRAGRVAGWPLLIQTALLTALLLLPALWLGRRVGLPLRTLTRVADGFLTGRDAPPLPTGGPPDVRALCDAFEALEARVLGVLEERAVALGAIGHDLRTPLTALRIRVEEIAEPDLRSEMIASIERLSGTLDDILALSAASGQAGREQVRAGSLLRELEREYRDQPVRFERAGDVTLHCTPEAVKRALRNLVDNAVFHGGSASVVTETLPGRIAFIVRDSGPGIPETELERLQRPFERQDPSRNRQTGGAGLGLAIVRAVAKAHHGNLTLRNRPQGGLEASLVLPVNSAS